MGGEFLSLINAENINKIIGLTFMIMLFIGVTDLQKNIEKIGE